MIFGKIGVVTVTYNSSTFIDAFVDSLGQQKYENFHTYIIDNLSHDDTLEKLKRRFTDIPFSTIVANSSNVGIAAGNNQGILMALNDGCEWVLLLNNDTTFSPDFLDKLKSACVRRGLRVGVPKIHFDIPAGYIWYGGGGFRPSRGYTGYHVGIGEADRGQFDTETCVEYSPTCAMLIHHSVFQQSGLMDEAYFVYFDDTDFCWRLREVEIPIGYIPEVSIVHKVGGSTGGTQSLFTCGITARNRVYFIRKNLGHASVIVWIPIFLLYYVLRYGLRGDVPRLKASIMGTLGYRTLVTKVPELASNV